MNPEQGERIARTETEKGFIALEIPHRRGDFPILSKTLIRQLDGNS